MTGVSWAGWWPILDDAVPVEALIDEALADLIPVLAAQGRALDGTPRFTVVDEPDRPGLAVVAPITQARVTLNTPEGVAAEVERLRRCGVPVEVAVRVLSAGSEHARALLAACPRRRVLTVAA